MRPVYTVQINCDLGRTMPERVDQATTWLASAVLINSQDYTPYKEGTLLRTAHAERVSVNERDLVYVGRYARYIWEGKRMVNAATGKGPAWIPSIPGYRFPKGSHLVPTTDPLHYTRDTHALAQDHWVMAAETVYGDTWRRGVGEILTHGHTNI